MIFIVREQLTPYSAFSYLMRWPIICLSLFLCAGCQDSLKEQPPADDGSPLGEVIALLDAPRHQAVATDRVDSKEKEYRFENWYPDDITPPRGTRYPCAITALPKDLEGVPAIDRQFINHTYALLLRAVHAKLVVMKYLGTDKEVAVYKKYATKTNQIRSAIVAQHPPNDAMARFKAAVLDALNLQIIFFKKVIGRTDIHVVADRLMAVPEGKQASDKLKKAWTVTLAEYPELSKPMRDSLFHHLCALDVF